MLSKISIPLLFLILHTSLFAYPKDMTQKDKNAINNTCVNTIRDPNFLNEQTYKPFIN